MSPGATSAGRLPLSTRLLAGAALASWPVPLGCIALRSGAAAAARMALPILLVLGALSAAQRLVLRRDTTDFALFFPVRGAHQGTFQSIRVIGALLLCFDLGAAWFLLRNPLSHVMTVILIVLITVSAMNLADECWIARRRRRRRVPLR